MRDDLKGLLKELNLLYKNKIILLEKILLSETEKKYALKAKNTDLLLKNFEENDDQIDDINSIDYEISSKNESICNIIGIKNDQWDEFIKTSEVPLFMKINDFQKKIKNIVQDLISERDKIIEELEKESISIEKDMDSLQRIYRLNSEKK